MKCCDNTNHEWIKTQTARYKGLISSVALMAIEDYQDELKKQSYVAALASEPGRYFHSDSELPYSFLWCCAVLDMDPNGIRSRLNTRGLIQEMRKVKTLQAKYANERIKDE